MAIIDSILQAANPQPLSQQPVANTAPPQSSWVSDLITQHFTDSKGYTRRTPTGFQFQREPFDPSSYYKQLTMYQDINKAATEVTRQEAANKAAAQTPVDTKGATNGVNANFTYSKDGKSYSSNGKVQAIISYGMKQLGKPYIFGNEGPGSFDCSGLMQYIFGKNGVRLPRTAAQQQRASTRVNNPRAGDLVFYGNPAHHVALYLGNGKMLAAPHSGAVVRVQPVYGNPTYGRI